LRKQNKTVGVLAIDPSSPFSGGAILGDRVRMQRHSLDQGVFIRSLATRGHFGGLTESTRSAIDVLDAMGKDYVLVETVGVGQDEVDIVKTAYTTVVALSPGMGDGIQAIKAGILEVADIFVINKADRDGTDKTFSDLRLMIDLDESKYLNGRWKPPILKTQAVLGEGIEELLEEIEKHRKYGIERSEGGEFTKRKDAIHEELAEMVKGRLLKEVFHRLIKTGEFQRAVESIARKDTDPYTACDKLISSELGEG
jgi:LAO/AO transport system kinase